MGVDGTGQEVEMMAATGGLLIGGFFLFVVVLGVISLGLWIWSLIHCANNKELDDNNRLVGLILIVCLGLLGSLVYLFLPRNNSSGRQR